MHHPSSAPRSSKSISRTRLLLIAAAVQFASSCFEPRAQYHRDDYKFSWQQEDVDEERRASMIYTQPPKATNVEKD